MMTVMREFQKKENDSQISEETFGSLLMDNSRPELKFDVSTSCDAYTADSEYASCIDPVSADLSIADLEKQSDIVNDLKNRITDLQASENNNTTDLENLSTQLNQQMEILRQMTTNFVKKEKCEKKRKLQNSLTSCGTASNICSPCSAQKSSESCRMRTPSSDQVCGGKMFDALDKRVNNLQCELSKLSSLNSSSRCPSESFNNAEQMKKALAKDLYKLNCEISAFAKKQAAANCGARGKPPKPKCKCTIAKDQQIMELNQNYDCLLREYGRKECECKALKEKLERIALMKTKEASEKNDSNVLKRKCIDLLEDQEQFKLLVKEQSDQLEEYRTRFLCAQQSIEEQKCKIQSLEANNKRVEEEINIEISRIKGKFQERLKELCPLPKLLENETKKLRVCSQEKDEFEKKLNCMCKEFTAMKEKYEKLKSEGANDGPRLKELMAENGKLRCTLEKLCTENTCLQSKLTDSAKELEELRAESAKIIARNKECCNTAKDALQQQIHKLELEVAQCRATSSLMISERDEALKRMQKQMNVLACNFQEAQDQVQKLQCQMISFKLGNK